MPAETPQDLDDLMAKLEGLAEASGATVSVGEVYRTFGARSFGPLLLVAGLLGMTPLSAIPTVPTVLATIVVLVAGQLALGRQTLWLPKRLLRLSIDAHKLQKSLAVARRPARFIDRLIRPRLCWMTSRVGQRLVALACIVVAAAVPPLELLPFVAFVPASAIAAFGLGLVTRDGLVIILALAATAVTLALIARQLLG